MYEKTNTVFINGHFMKQFVFLFFLKKYEKTVLIMTGIVLALF